MGVVFFPSFPFMRVMLFPSFVLGNASGESGVLLVPLSPFSPILSLSLLLFLLSLYLCSPFPSPSLSHSHSFFSLSSFSFFFEGTACIVYFRDVRDDTADCNQLYLYWNKENFSFLAREFVYFDVCNFLIHSLAELSVFLLQRCPAF